MFATLALVTFVEQPNLDILEIYEDKGHNKLNAQVSYKI